MSANWQSQFALMQSRGLAELECVGKAKAEGKRQEATGKTQGQKAKRKRQQAKGKTLDMQVELVMFEQVIPCNSQAKQLRELQYLTARQTVDHTC